MINTIAITCDRREYESGPGKLMEDMAYARIVVDDLDAGNYIIGERSIVNRMKAADFVAAAVNRSLYPAIELMREQNDQVIIVIEGNALATRSFIEPESMIETIAWMTIMAGVQTVISDTPEHSAALIAMMARLRQNGLGYPLPLRHSTPLHSSSVLTRYVLEGLPGINTTVAAALGKHFGSLYNLANANLEELQATPGVGYGLGQKVYNVMRIGGEETEKNAE